MPDTIANNKDIKELQRLAQEAPATSIRPRRKPPSRAAQLEAIDLLSRWSAAGIALIAGIGIYLSITVGRSYPWRAAAWAFMLLCALWIARRMQAQFRAGAASAARPFRWRASFAASLAVLGVAFASAPILLTPAAAPSALGTQAAALVLLGAFGGAIFFAAHLNSTAAFIIPGVIFPVAAAVRNGEPGLALYSLLASAAGIAAIIAIHASILAALNRRHPRTGFLRSEVSGESGYESAGEAGRQTA